MTSARVLIVDDDEGIRLALRDLLGEEGFEIAGIASDGEEAVRLAMLAEPDVILMDMRMPGMDGLAAARSIREADPIAQVVILSAYDDPAFTEGAEEVGVYGYLVKGCSAGLICDVVRQAAALRRGLEERRRSA